MPALCKEELKMERSILQYQEFLETFLILKENHSGQDYNVLPTTPTKEDSGDGENRIYN